MDIEQLKQLLNKLKKMNANSVQTGKIAIDESLLFNTNINIAQTFNDNFIENKVANNLLTHPRFKCNALSHETDTGQITKVSIKEQFEKFSKVKINQVLIFCLDLMLNGNSRQKQNFVNFLTNNSESAKLLTQCLITQRLFIDILKNTNEFNELFENEKFVESFITGVGSNITSGNIDLYEEGRFDASNDMLNDLFQLKIQNVMIANNIENVKSLIQQKEEQYELDTDLIQEEYNKNIIQAQNGNVDAVKYLFKINRLNIDNDKIENNKPFEAAIKTVLNDNIQYLFYDCKDNKIFNLYFEQYINGTIDNYVKIKIDNFIKERLNNETILQIPHNKLTECYIKNHLTEVMNSIKILLEKDADFSIYGQYFWLIRQYEIAQKTIAQIKSNKQIDFEVFTNNLFLKNNEEVLNLLLERKIEFMFSNYDNEIIKEYMDNPKNLEKINNILSKNLPMLFNYIRQINTGIKDNPIIEKYLHNNKKMLSELNKLFKNNATITKEERQTNKYMIQFDELEKYNSEREEKLNKAKKELEYLNLTNIMSSPIARTEEQKAQFTSECNEEAINILELVQGYPETVLLHLDNPNMQNIIEYAVENILFDFDNFMDKNSSLVLENFDKQAIKDYYKDHPKKIETILTKALNLNIENKDQLMYLTNLQKFIKANNSISQETKIKLDEKMQNLL